MKTIIFCCIIVLALYTPTFANPVLQTISRKVSLGGKIASGNTNSSNLHADFSLNRNRKWKDETSFIGSFDQESVNDILSMNKWSLSARHAGSIQKQDYSFVRLDLDHDRFKDIKLRTIPAIGYGHWFSSLKEYKLLAEIALGYQKQTLLNNTYQDSFLLQIRGFGKSRIFDDETISEDFYAYIDAENMNSFRLVSTTTFLSPLSKNFSLKILIKDEYTNQPPSGIRRNDLLFSLGLEYLVETVTE
ncbi:MAG: DUF481 domain-containing protein [Candidatus Saganbacteria bacterium]|nr:DUF481 domain-containing protein [Candidatus Saganbacteria bacterium]